MNQTDLNIIFWVEARKEIGMGHFFECFNLARYFNKNKYPVKFILNNYEPAEKLLNSCSFSYITISKDDCEQSLKAINNNNKINIIFVNHRLVDLYHLKLLRKLDYKVVVIDQLGNKPIIADILINYSLVQQWHKYDFPFKKPECLFGSKYAILHEDYLSNVFEKTDINKPEILITMGGVDRTGATIRIIEALLDVQNITKTVVVGPGFNNKQRLESIRDKTDSSFRYIFNQTGLAKLMETATLAITAGGNTMYELAYMGIPGIVLWEDEHEREMAEEFEKAGCAINLGNGIQTPVNCITNSVCELINDIDTRNNISSKCRKLVDGNGISRIMKESIKLADCAFDDH